MPEDCFPELWAVEKVGGIFGTAFAGSGMCLGGRGSWRAVQAVGVRWGEALGGSGGGVRRGRGCGGFGRF